MNLYEAYLEAQNAENDMSSEIKQILEGGQLNFTYNDIRIINAYEYNDHKNSISFIAYGLNNKPRNNFVIEVSRGFDKPTVFAYETSIVGGGFFPRLTLDNLTIERLIDYSKEQSEYFRQQYTVDKIGRKVRPNEVDCAYFNRLTNAEIETLKQQEIEGIKMESSR